MELLMSLSVIAFTLGLILVVVSSAKHRHPTTLATATALVLAGSALVVGMLAAFHHGQDNPDLPRFEAGCVGRFAIAHASAKDAAATEKSTTKDAQELQDSLRDSNCRTEFLLHDTISKLDRSTNFPNP